MKMWTMNLGKPTKVPPLNEAMAIEMGSQILGEAAIFVTAAFLICVEYWRQSHNEEVKEEMAKAEMYKIDNKIEQLAQQLDKQSTWLQTLAYAIDELNQTTTIPTHSQSHSRLNESKPTATND